jgi:hypothetical protein
MLVNNSTPSPPASIPFGYSGNIPVSSGDFFEINNNGYSTIAFNCQCPPQGAVSFRASFDGVNFDSVTFRQMGNDGYTQESSEDSNYIGSVIGARKIRFVNLTGAANSGTIMGTLSRDASILEGLEHSSPPHKFGNALFHMGINVSGSSIQNSGLFFPSKRHKFAVSYISLSVSSQNGTYITFHEGSGTAGDPSKWIISNYVKVNSNDTQFLNAVLSTPFVAADLNSGLFLTVEGDATIRGVVHGYETEN